MVTSPVHHCCPEARSYLMKNDNHDITGVYLGRYHPTVLGVIFGITPGETTLDQEYAKAVRASRLGVHTVTDVSTNGDPTLRRRVLESLDIVFGTVPTYDIHRRIRRKGKDPRTAVLSVLEEHAADGVDFLTIHASGSLSEASRLGVNDRVIPVTSRGGAMMAEVMTVAGHENPYWEYFDDVLELCRAQDIALSLAGTFRPGSVVDAMGPVHLGEVRRQADLVKRAHAMGVKVSVELINHVPLNLIPEYCELGKETLDGCPFGGLGPSPTDIAVTYDDVAGAIGAATAVMHGTSWITCVTAGEHCHMPTIDDMTQAVKYFQIATHIGHIARTRDLSRDAELSEARNRNDWAVMAKTAIHHEDAVVRFEHEGYHDGQSCSMCGGACPLVRAKTIPS